MPGTHLTCKKCGGYEFKQIRIDSWQCLTCGQVRRAPKNKRISIDRKQIPKESIRTSATYKPLVAYCEQCGEKLDRIGHPQDERRLNNKWGNHVCSVTKKRDLFYT